MIIHVVEEGETIYSIAQKYNVSVTNLIRDNKLTDPKQLVIGETIVIAYPQKTYLVKEGDTLLSVSNENDTSIMHLIQNNPYLIDRNYLVPGETLIISYGATRTITTNAYAFPFIDKRLLKKALPYLTYLSIFNYKSNRGGGLDTYYDETEVIQATKRFGVAPLMLITNLSIDGKPDVDLVYQILLNEEFQNMQIEAAMKIIKSKGYFGVNLVFQYMTETTQELYYQFLKKSSERLKQEGYTLILTLNPNFKSKDNSTNFEKIDFSKYINLVDGINFMSFDFGKYNGEPKPVSSNFNKSLLIDYAKNLIPSNLINIQSPTYGYDFELPYIEGKSQVCTLSIESALSLARTMKVKIQFDEISMTPFYEYVVKRQNEKVNHIVWFIDARTIDGICKLVSDDGLQGTGSWNVMTYYAQLWLVQNVRFLIEKKLPDLL